MLAGIFSLIALLLIAVGTYGVLSYAVAQRRREIGVRMALGARPEQIRGQFLALALRLLAAGTVLGIIGAWLTGQAMRTLLFQVPPLHVRPLRRLRVSSAWFRLSLVCCRLTAPPGSRQWRLWPTSSESFNRGLTAKRVDAVVVGGYYLPSRS